MAMTEREDDRVLEPFFAAARARPPEPGPDLLARVLAEAEAVQAARPAAVRDTGAAAAGPSGWRALIGVLGGWGGAGGLLAAGVAGLWIGFSGIGALGAASTELWGGAGAILDADLGADGVFSLILDLEAEA